MEDFVDLKGFEGCYKINKLGELISVKRGNKLNPTFDKRTKTVKASMSVNGKRSLVALHKLVYLTFIGEIPYESGKKYCIKHRDGDPTNCSVQNLYLSDTSIIPGKKTPTQKPVVKPIKKAPVAKQKPEKKSEVKIQRGFEKVYNQNSHYTTNDELLYNTILSKGMGKVSKSLEIELYKIAEGVWTKLTKNLYYSEFKYDM